MSIEERIKKLVASQLGIGIDQVKAADTFEQHGIDSLDEVELIMNVEDEFDITISDEEADRIKTVQQAIDAVTAKVPA